MKLLLSLLMVVLLGTSTQAQDKIVFNNVSWSVAKQEAIKANKLIFIDFYTQWCGPCFLMDEEIFPLLSVREFYSKNFYSVKIDAEHGEGINIAKQFNVASYPTYLFVDPNTEKIVHRSGSRMDEDAFLFTGASALDSTKTSVYLNQQHAAGNESLSFLTDYIAYQASLYNTKSVIATLQKMSKNPDYTLANPKVWNLFVKSVSGRDNIMFKEVISNKEKYSKLFGEAIVDAKLFKEYKSLVHENEIIEGPSFNGKNFLIKTNKANRLIRANEYNEAALLIKELMNEPTDFKDELCEFLYRTGYYTYVLKISQPETYSEFWKKNCIGYLQYAAYNAPDRTISKYHFAYAKALENVLNSTPAANSSLPKNFAEPTVGTKEYTERSPKLLSKPQKVASK